MTQSIRTPENETELLQALRVKPTFRYAARRARVSKSAFADWRRDDAAFAARCNAARLEGMQEVIDELVDRGLDGDTTALIFLAKSYFRETFGDKVDHTHQGMITFAADWTLVRAAIFEVLARHPGALADVAARLDALEPGEDGNG